MSTFLLVHGGWAGGWYWEKVDSGHSPQYSGPEDLAAHLVRLEGGG